MFMVLSMELCKFFWILSMEVVIFSVMDHPSCGDPSPAEEEAGLDTCLMLGNVLCSVLGLCSVLLGTFCWTESPPSVSTELNLC